MNIMQLFYDAAQVAKGDQKAMLTVSRTKDASRWGQLMVVLAVAVGAMGAFVFPRHISEVLVYRLSFWDAMRAFIGHLFLTLIMIYMMAALVWFFTNEKWGFKQLVPVFSYMWMVHLLTIVPVLAYVSVPWYLYLVYLFLSKSVELKPIEITGVLLIPILVHSWIFSDLYQLFF